MFCAALLAARASWALDYRSVAEAAPAYDAPSAKAKPLFVMHAGTPVELVVSLDGWSKLRDGKGDLVWMEKKHLADKRTVIVRVERAQVRTTTDEKSPLVFEAERDVVLEMPGLSLARLISAHRRDVVLDLIEAAPGGWVKVRHRDGQTGFLKVAQVWGM